MSQPSVKAATLTVSAGGDLQAALNAAQPGDEIVLEAGATFVGTFTLPNKAGASYITVRSSAESALPAAGVRVAPADAANMPKIASPGYGTAALATEQSAHHYKFIGIEFKPVDANAFIYNLINLGDPSPAQNSLDKVPHDLILDRCYIHTYEGQELKRGIELDSAETSVINCYIAGFKVVGQDSQAIAGFNGPGPFHIINNYLEAAGENIIFGGSDAQIPNLVPSDIEIRHNYFFKPLSWYVNDPSFVPLPGGGHWTVKNLLELKNAQRVVIDSNVLENNWGDAQTGYAILLTVRNQDGGAPWSVVQDVQFTNNIVRHSGAGLNISGYDNNHPSQHTNNIVVRNNLFDDINSARYGGDGVFLLIAEPDAVTIDHNTVFHNYHIISVYGAPTTNFVFTNNLLPHNQYGIKGDSRGTGNDTINTYFPGAVVRRNAFIATPYPPFYPPDNFFPADVNAVGFVDYAGGNYRLASTSPYKNAGTDGKDVGADIDAINAAMNPSSTPFGGTSPTVPGIIEAENFDNGGEGIAYHDIDVGNNGGVYRSTDVDVRANSTASNGYDVFNAYPGEWLKYTVNVTSAGTYSVGARVASRLEGGTFHIEVDGVDVTGSLKAPTTGSWYTFQYVGRTGVSLTAGRHVLRLSLDTAGVEGIIADFDTLSVTASSSSPFTGTPATVPGAVEAENFDNGGEGVAYHDVDVGNNGAAYRSTDVDVRAVNTASNGYVVFNAYPGEWLKYTVNVTSAGTYSVGARVASRLEGGTFHIEVDGVNVTGSLKAPTTGSWWDFQTVSKSGVNLSAGTHVLRVVLDTAGVEGIVADFDTININ